MALLIAKQALDYEISGAIKTAALVFLGALLVFAFAIYVSNVWDRQRILISVLLVATGCGLFLLWYIYLPAPPSAPILRPAPTPIPTPVPIEDRARLDALQMDVYHENWFLKVNILFQNRGKMYVNKFPVVRCGVYIKDHVLSPSEEDELFARYHEPEEFHSPGPTTGENPIKPGEPYAYHCASPLPFDGDMKKFDQMFKEMYEGKRLIYLTIKIDFNDRVGPLHQESCYVFKGLIPKGKKDDGKGWSKCWAHNDAPQPVATATLSPTPVP